MDRAGVCVRREVGVGAEMRSMLVCCVGGGRPRHLVERDFARDDEIDAACCLAPAEDLRPVGVATLLEEGREAVEHTPPRRLDERSEHAGERGGARDPRELRQGGGLDRGRLLVHSEQLLLAELESLVDRVEPLRAGKGAQG